MAEPHTALKSRRKELGLTLRDVEHITQGQISNAYLSQLENGKIKNPSSKMMFALAACYHVSIETMQGWLDFPMPYAPSLCPTCGRVMMGGSRYEFVRTSSAVAPKVR